MDCFSVADVCTYDEWDRMGGCIASEEWKPLVISRDSVRIASLSGQVHCTVATNDDGACALHSVFGIPLESQRYKLFRGNARARLVATFGNTPSEFRSRLRSEGLFNIVTSALWRDLLHPILLRECGVEKYPKISTAGLILWSQLSRSKELQKKYIKFVEDVIVHETQATGMRERVYSSFARVCTKHYVPWLTIFAAILEWDADGSPSEILFGRETVKGTQENMPVIDRPSTKLDALIDPRPCFDALRRGFVEFHGSDLIIFQRNLQRTLSEYCPELRTDSLILRLEASIGEMRNFECHGYGNEPDFF